MLDKPTKDMDPARSWRFPRFLRFGDNGDKTAQPKTTKPPREPGERKHNYCRLVRTLRTPILGVMMGASTVLGPSSARSLRTG